MWLVPVVCVAAVVLRQAETVMRVAEDSVVEENDLRDVAHRYERLVATLKRLDAGEATPRVWRGER